MDLLPRIDTSAKLRTAHEALEMCILMLSRLASSVRANFFEKTVEVFVQVDTACPTPPPPPGGEALFNSPPPAPHNNKFSWCPSTYPQMSHLASFSAGHSKRFHCLLSFEKLSQNLDASGCYDSFTAS